MTENEPEPRPPSPALAGIAAAMPALFFGLSCGLYGATLIGVGPGGGASVVQTIREMGLASFALIGASGLMGAIGAGVCLLLAGRGKRVPAAVTVAMAILPWLMGLAFTAFGLARVWDALVMADPTMRAALMAMGIAEATNAELFGGVVGSAVCAGVAFGLAIAAVGQRAPERSPIGALIGGALVLPVLGLSLWAAWTARSSGLVLAISATGAVLACAVGGAGIGADAPHGRSGALGAAVPVAALLAVVMAAEAALSGASIEIFGALAHADPSQRAMLLAGAVAELRPVSAAATWTLPIGALGVMGLAGWSAYKSRPSGGRVAGGVALALVALGAVGADAAVNGWAQARAAALTELPWSGAEGFEPVRVASNDEPGEDLRVLLTPDGLTRLGGERAAGATRDSMRASLTDRVARTEGRRRAVTVDRRVGAPVLRAFFGALADQRVDSIALGGVSESSMTPEDAAEVAAVYPAVGALLEGPGWCRVVIADTRAPDALVHAGRRVTIARDAPDRFDAPAGVDPDLSPGRRRYGAGDPPPLHARLADDATAQSLVETCDRASQHHLQLVVSVSAP